MTLCKLILSTIESTNDNNSVLKDASKVVSTSVIADCCLVVDVLGDEVRFVKSCYEYGSNLTVIPIETTSLNVIALWN